MDESRDVVGALRRKGFLVSVWPWRALLHALTTPLVAAVAAAPLAPVGVLWAAAVVKVVRGEAVSGVMPVAALLLGAALAAALPVLSAPVAWAERWRLVLLGDERLAAVRPAPGLGAWVRSRYLTAAAWRETGYAVLLALAGTGLGGVLLLAGGVPLAMLLAPLLVTPDSPLVVLGWRAVTPADGLWFTAAGIALVPVLAYAVGLLGAGHLLVGRALLRGDEALRAELAEVAGSRARLVDRFDAERRRIERDLHDGAQERLVGLTLRLGLAKAELPENEDVAAAHDQAKRLMVELRELVRGIHPAVLTDRGLGAALAELADRSVVPVVLRAHLPTRPPAHLESVAYFVVAEAVANAVKHSGAGEVLVRAGIEGGGVVVEVRDDGRGGADPAAGSGLTGLADRVAVVGGRLSLSSPAGGPTVLRATLPLSG
ncbi:histidine kinase [Actinosynnema sp.]|uniref:sensor histidine kinase n=1 Tax=Actinosynnema sp. TaxID=1872144 RepID=UPI003F876049